MRIGKSFNTIFSRLFQSLKTNGQRESLFKFLPRFGLNDQLGGNVISSKYSKQ